MQSFSRTNASGDRLLTSTKFVFGVSLLSLLTIQPATAQGTQPATSTTQITELVEIIVTGSRIRRNTADTDAPQSVVSQQDLVDRGYVQVGEALNNVPSIAPSIPIAPGTGEPAGSGQQFPNLFGLGAGRTLTLVDGHRFVTSASGVGDQVVDTNLIPTGLLDRIEIVEAGGGAVYGSDAIAGVVNFILKKDFDGLELDAQTGLSSRGDYPQHSARATFGSNFSGGRGNIAANLEWSKSDSLLWKDRPETHPPLLIAAANPANTGSDDGIPAVLPIRDVRFWEWNYNGVVFSIPAPFTDFLLTQLSPDGSALRPFNPGNDVDIPFASGGDGFSYGDLSALYSGVERSVANLLGHYDLTNRLSLSGSLVVGRTRGSDPYGSQGPVHNILDSEESGAGPIMFFNTNPYLSPDVAAGLAQLSPEFGAGAPLFLSKQFGDLLPTREFLTTTDTYRAHVALDGDFDLSSRIFYYSAFYSHGETDGRTSGWDVNTARFNQAAQTLRNDAGNIVCASNAVTVVDPECVPLNIFGARSVSDAARAYLTVPVGSRYENVQDDLLFTLGGELLPLPGGTAKFSLGYEHRRENAKYVPSQANQAGLVGAGNSILPARGSYDTNEFSGELLIPILGPQFDLPFAKTVEINGQYRYVDNSLAGQESVWGSGLRWEVVDGLTLRASRSRNFRAPTLTQLLAPSVAALDYAGTDPCDERYIDAGSNPEVRRANCVALFAANPSYNGGTGSVVGYQDGNSNFLGSMVVSGGNRALSNEISNTTTYGVVLQPSFVPRLTVAIDRIEIDLRDGLSAFTPTEFLAACFDSVAMPEDVCSTFTRDDNGDVVTGTATTFNAGSIEYRGESYKIDYNFPLATAASRHWGTIDLRAEASHTSRLMTSVTGFDFTESAGTTATPKWSARFGAGWTRRALRVSYEAYYLASAKIDLTDTVESTPYPVVASNLRHSVSAAYDFANFQLRAGVTNLTDSGPSFPSLNYGDILGRRYFIGAQARL